MPRLLLATIAVLLLCAAPANAAVTRGWSETGKPADPRSRHAAVVLDSGKVLVAGGRQGPDALTSAELYDPVTGTWSSAAPMRKAREGFTLVKLRNGRVLAVGGDEDAGNRSAELYDPERNVWELTGSLSVPRWRPAIVGLTDGSVLVAGGYDEAADTTYASAELYNPETRVWAPAGTMPDPRFQALGVALPDGVAMITGGTTYVTSPEYAAYYNPHFPDDEIWSRRAQPDRGEASTLTPFGNGKVLAAGGSGDTAGDTADVWSMGQWSPTPRMANKHYIHATTGLRDGRVMVIGGLQGVQGSPVVEIFDGTSWSNAGPLAYGRGGHTATLLADGRVLVTGGGIAFGPMDVPSEVWTPTTTAVADSQLPFGAQVKDTTVTGTVRITNTGTEPLFTDEFELGGAHAGDFAIARDGCPRVVAAGDACRVEVRFTPTATGERNATLNLKANTVQGAYLVPLTGLGVIAPTIVTPGATADSDHDGVVDGSDRCVALAGAAGRQGCPAGALADPSIAYRRVKGGIHVVSYFVTATTGARIVVTCSKGCKRTVAKGAGSRRVRIRGLSGKRLKNGTRITVTVTVPGRLTTTVSDRVVRGRRIEGRPVCTAAGTPGALGC